jgi:hypothetical protein
MELQLFTIKDYDAGLRPTRLRDGRTLKQFTYFPGALFCFVGVDSNGNTHLWKGTGRKNGKVNKMRADLVKEVLKPFDEIIYIARTRSGNPYSGTDRKKLVESMTKADEFDLFRLDVNFKKVVVNSFEFLETIKKKP